MKEESEQVRKAFDEACAKIWKWFHLNEDLHFTISDDPVTELKELKEKCNTPEAIAEFNEEYGDSNAFQEVTNELEKQVEYNNIVDEIDLIYADILKYAKLIANDPEAFGLDSEKFLVELSNMGTFKEDIDTEKDFNEAATGEKIYPEMERVAPISDTDELKKFLLG